jgi:ABC-2 type transport system permease protein
MPAARPAAGGAPWAATTLRRPGGVIRTLQKCLAVLRVTLASRFAYVGDLLIRTLFLLLILFIFTQLWRATGKSQDVLALTGFSIARLIWYLAFTEALVTSAPPLGDSEIDREVRSGDLAYRLARPLGYPLFHLGAQMGERFLRFAINLLAGCLIALLVAGPVRLHPPAAALAVGLAFLAMLVDWIWAFTISLLSFWIENTFGLHLLYRRCLMILGGMLLPLEAYPGWLAGIASRLPFQYLIYQPARLFVQGDLAGWPRAAGALLLLAAAGLIPLTVIYRLGLRRVAAQGG